MPNRAERRKQSKLSSKNSNAQSTTQLIESTQVTSGPLPPASELEKLHSLNPDYVDRIISLAEKEQNHMHQASLKALENDNKIIDSNHLLGVNESKNYRFGQYAAVTVCIGVLSLSAYLIYKDSYIQATTIVTVTIAAIITRFVSNKRKS